MAEYVYPPGALTSLKEAWAEFVPRRGEGGPLPSDAVLQSILEVCFFGSLRVEEGRRLHPRLTLVGGMPAIAIRLAQPRPFTVDELTRLAPACPPGCYLGRSTDETGARLVGFVAEPAWDDFTIQVRGLGHVIVSRGDLPIFEYRSGRCARVDAGATDYVELLSLLDDAAKELFADIDYSGLGNAFNPTREYPDVFISIISGVSDLAHGGTLLIVPDGISPVRLSQLLRMKYACTTEKYAAWLALRNSVRNQAYRMAGPEAYADEVAARADQEEWQEHVAVVNAFSERVPALSAVDGAVLVTDRLRILGFGCEILSSQSLTGLLVDAQGSPIDYELFGTRHRSAARFALECPGALAFVCSQDGGVRRFTRQSDGRVLVRH